MYLKLSKSKFILKIFCGVFFLLLFIKYTITYGATLNEYTFNTSSNEKINYLLYTPEDTSTNTPLIIYLHGGSCKGNDINLLKQTDFCKWTSEGKFSSANAYILIPQLSNKYNGWDSCADNIKQLIDYVCKNYNIDTETISITGHSMGGTGTYALAARYPNLFYRVAPVSGSIKITPSVISALAKTQIWAFVGSSDNIVPPTSSQNIINTLRKNNNVAKITIFQGATHFDTPKLTYLDNNIDLLNWLVDCNNNSSDFGFSTVFSQIITKISSNFAN